MTALFYGALLVLGVMLLVVTLVRVLVGGLEPGSGRPGRPSGTGGARQILEERYAAGELSAEEYQHRLRVLGEGRA
ncbi:MAG: SHOCT domain-containing protein [Nocardioides sp.]|nr:SHOCT domain-containing protein [Nocardioides sp.]